MMPQNVVTTLDIPGTAKLIQAWLFMYVSAGRVVIGTGNGLSPVRCHTMLSTASDKLAWINFNLSMVK